MLPIHHPNVAHSTLYLFRIGKAGPGWVKAGLVSLVGSCSKDWVACRRLSDMQDDHEIHEEQEKEREQEQKPWLLAEGQLFPQLFHCPAPPR